MEANECDLNVFLEADKSMKGTLTADGAEYRDGSGKLILEEKTERKGNKKVYSCKVYSLKYDFSIHAEPVTYVYGLPDYPLSATITYSDGRKTEYTAEELGFRSYTGTWYFGICSNVNGQLGEYQVR